MSRNRAFHGAHVIDTFDPTDEPSRPGPPADGCTGTPWCECFDCARVPTGGFFPFEEGDPS